MRAFIALHIAAGPPILLRTCCDGIWVFGTPHAQFPRVLHGTNMASGAGRTTTGCGRWSQVDNPNGNSEHIDPLMVVSLTIPAGPVESPTN